MSDTLRLGGELEVRRLGFGAIRVERPEVIRRAVELGVDFIDTADIYGGGRSEELVAEDVLALCEGGGLGFVPWRPLGEGLREPRYELRWLLDRSPVVLPIPGTSSIEHLEENMRA